MALNANRRPARNGPAVASTDERLAVYRFAVEDLYRQQEHVLDDKGERLLSLSSRFSSAPNDAYASLSTADLKSPTITLPSGAACTLTYGQYRALLATNRSQADRAAAFAAFHETYRGDANTYAALYNGVLQRDWFHAQARGYKTMLEAALHGNNIPTAVVENLIAQAKAGAAPLQRYHRLRRSVLGLETLPHVRFGDPARRDRREVSLRRGARLAAGARSRRSAPSTSSRCARSSPASCIDVYENKGKRSGAYSAPVYGCPPVHADELQRHARCRVHARARDGPLDAHRARRTSTSRSSTPATRSSSRRCRPR